MVNKRYMQKCDTCVGYKARINKFLLKKPPCIMSADSTSSVCEQSASLYEPLKAIRERGKKRNVRQKIYKKWTEEGDEHRVRC